MRYNIREKERDKILMYRYAKNISNIGSKSIEIYL